MMVQFHGRFGYRIPPVSRVMISMAAALMTGGLAAQEVAGTAPDASAQARRIAELERRVERLESLLRQLAENRQVETGPSDETLAGLLRELDGPAKAEPTSAPARAAVAKPAAVAPSPAPGAPSGTAFQELLPQLGKIGGAASLLVGGHTGPFSLNSGSFAGGAIELPLRLLPGGRLHYEISAGLMRSTTTGPVTSNVAQVANLAVLGASNPQGGLANVAAAVSGTGAAPFPVTARAEWRLQMLQVTPFALKYTFTGLDRYRLRPYVVGGVGVYVTLTRQDTPALGLRTDATLDPAVKQAIESSFANGSPFGGSLIGGQVSAAPELKARRIPSGQGGILLGGQFGGGFEWRISRTLSLGLEARYNRLGNGVSYVTPALRTGFRF